jgi:rod shape-determining protein MreD
MINLWLRNTWRFIFLVLFQVLILDNIQISGFINPYMYVLFILLMPFQTPGWLLIVSGFALGMTMDLFHHTLGMHASATVFMAFLRPAVLRMFAPRDGYEPNTFPRIFYYGLPWFTKYTLILVFAHHLLLFFLEAFSFSGFFLTMGRIIMSSVFSILLIILSQYFIFRK